MRRSQPFACPRALSRGRTSSMKTGFAFRPSSIFFAAPRRRAPFALFRGTQSTGAFCSVSRRPKYGRLLLCFAAPRVRAPSAFRSSSSLSAAPRRRAPCLGAPGALVSIVKRICASSMRVPANSARRPRQLPTCQGLMESLEMASDSVKAFATCTFRQERLLSNHFAFIPLPIYVQVTLEKSPALLAHRVGREVLRPKFWNQIPGQGPREVPDVLGRKIVRNFRPKDIGNFPKCSAEKLFEIFGRRTSGIFRSARPKNCFKSSAEAPRNFFEVPGQKIVPNFRPKHLGNFPRCSARKLFQIFGRRSSGIFRSARPENCSKFSAEGPRKIFEVLSQEIVPNFRPKVLENFSKRSARKLFQIFGRRSSRIFRSVQPENCSKFSAEGCPTYLDHRRPPEAKKMFKMLGQRSPGVPRPAKKEK